MALPSHPQEHGPPVSGETPSALLPPRKASLPDLVRLLPRSRRRGLEGVGATPKPTTQKIGALSCISIASPLSVSQASSRKHWLHAMAKKLPVFPWRQRDAT